MHLYWGLLMRFCVYFLAHFPPFQAAFGFLSGMTTKSTSLSSVRTYFFMFHCLQLCWITSSETFCWLPCLHVFVGSFPLIWSLLVCLAYHWRFMVISRWGDHRYRRWRLRMLKTINLPQKRRQTSVRTSNIRCVPSVLIWTMYFHGACLFVPVSDGDY